jgi:hypothetical protein
MRALAGGLRQISVTNEAGFATQSAMLAAAAQCALN